MDRFIMVQQLEVEDEEAEDEGEDEYDEKNSFKSEYGFDPVSETSGLLHAAPSTL
jgi:hypothetical protein